MTHRNNAILLLILLTMPHQGFSMTPHAQPARYPFLQKILYLPRLIATYKQQQNKPSQQSHLLHRPLVWAAGLSGALIIGYMLLRHRPSNPLPSSFPPVPNDDPAWHGLRDSTARTSALMETVDNAFDAGRIENTSLEIILQGRLPKNPPPQK